MLPDKIRLEIATPDRLVLSQEIDEVILPSVEGYMGVRPGHAPLLAALDVGEISYRSGAEQHLLACSGGFVEVRADSVSILAETAEPAEEIDVERAERAKKRAEERLGADLSDSEFKRAEVSLKKAVSRLRVFERGKG
jgi:F-type H+-transporting ATPase subunit epsilon